MVILDLHLQISVDYFTKLFLEKKCCPWKQIILFYKKVRYRNEVKW